MFYPVFKPAFKNTLGGVFKDLGMFSEIRPLWLDELVWNDLDVWEE